MLHKLSFWETVDAFLGWISVGAGVIYAAISGPFRDRSGADTYHHHIIQAAVKKLTTRFSPLQLQYLFKSYDQIYLDYCQKKTLILGENECHVAPLIWPMFGDYHETEQGRALKHWLLERLG